MRIVIHSLGNNHLEVKGVEQHRAMSIAESLTDTKPVRMQVVTGNGICFVASRAVFAVEVFSENNEELKFVFAQEKE